LLKTFGDLNLVTLFLECPPPQLQLPSWSARRFKEFDLSTTHLIQRIWLERTFSVHTKEKKQLASPLMIEETFQTHKRDAWGGGEGGASSYKDTMLSRMLTKVPSTAGLACSPPLTLIGLGEDKVDLANF
jgi:hypothetical protein